MDDRKNIAIELRRKGKSIDEIAQLVGAAKSSISIWTREVTLTDVQKAKLQHNCHSKESVAKRRAARLHNEQVKRQTIRTDAYGQVGVVTKRELWLIGTALYWAEGGKTQRMVRFSNGDPEMIKLMMRYFREVCQVAEDRFRGHIHIHESLDSHKAEKYWSEISGISQQKFYKTYNKPNISSKGKRKTLPYGVFDVYVADVTLFLKIEGWTKALCQQK